MHVNHFPESEGCDIQFKIACNIEYVLSSWHFFCIDEEIRLKQEKEIDRSFERRDRRGEDISPPMSPKRCFFAIG